MRRTALFLPAMSPTPSLSQLPPIADLLGKEKLAKLPTPVREHSLQRPGGTRSVSVKLDNLSGDLYGGNKVRKLEYILYRARERERECVATFGTVGSHHALATALYSTRLGYPCICFLSNQRTNPSIADSLRMHAQLGTTIVRYGGPYRQRLQILRKHLWGRQPWVVPAGGSNWLGCFGFVCAGIELATQVSAGLLPPPDRLYVATGTMGTAAGLALGLAVSGLATEVHAVRVAAPPVCNAAGLKQLIGKTARMMHRLDGSIPAAIEDRVRVVLRHEFFAGGYAHSDEQTRSAITVAKDELGLQLEETYTGKAMAAMLQDLGDRDSKDKRFLFWNTYNSAALPLDFACAVGKETLPAEFLRYFD